MIEKIAIKTILFEQQTLENKNKIGTLKNCFSTINFLLNEITKQLELGNRLRSWVNF